MTLEQIRRLAININDARLEGRMTREVHAWEIAFIDRKLSAAGFTWEDLA
jgi:hypothetical protein